MSNDEKNMTKWEIIQKAKKNIAEASTVFIENQFKDLSKCDTGDNKLMTFYMRKDAVKYLKALGLPQSQCERLETRWHVFYAINLGRNEFVVYSQTLFDDAKAILTTPYLEHFK